MIKDLILFPFRVIVLFAGLVIKVTGKILSLILGILFIIGGFLLCATIIGAIIGVPLILLGLSIIFTSLFK